MPLLNMELLKSPQNWARVLLMLAIGFAAIFLVTHFIASKAVGESE